MKLELLQNWHILSEHVHRYSWNWSILPHMITSGIKISDFFAVAYIIILLYYYWCNWRFMNCNSVQTCTEMEKHKGWKTWLRTLYLYYKVSQGSEFWDPSGVIDAGFAKYDSPLGSVGWKKYRIFKLFSTKKRGLSSVTRPTSRSLSDLRSLVDFILASRWRVRWLLNWCVSLMECLTLHDWFILGWGY